MMQKRSSNQNLHKVVSVIVILCAFTTVGLSQNWSSPATWGGSVPTAGQNVVIPAGQTVVIDTNTASLGLVSVEGTLRFSSSVDATLTAKHIIVHGRLEAGTASSANTRNCRIVLTGADDANYEVHGMGTGTKGLIVCDGGVLDLHGSRKTSVYYSKLTTTANPGATQVTIGNTSSGWRVGDKICFAPTGILPSQTEVATITSISGGTVQFTPALQYQHWGVNQTYDGKTVDQRAEVGLLTRNIVISGDPSSASSQFGAHVMIMEGGKAYVEGVLFTLAGQKGKLGRYPFHWHLTGDGSGQYIRDCSIDTSFRRGIVVHGTDSTLVRRNTLYNIVDHSIVTEDGSEMLNTFEYNLVMYTKKKAPEDITPRSGSINHSEARPGSFWMRNPHNYVRYNIAAGGENAMGFFYDSNGNATPGIPFPGYEPGTKVLQFANNTAHSYTGPSGGNDQYPTTTTGWGLFVFEFSPGNRLDSTFTTFNAYKCNIGGAWIEADNALTASTISDCGTGVLAVSAGSGAAQRTAFIETSLIVGQTANTNQSPDIIRGGVIIDADDQLPVAMKDLAFVNQSPAGIRVNAARFTPLSLSSEKIRAINCAKFMYNYAEIPPQAGGNPNYPRGADHNYTPTGYFLDKDGSISGVTGSPRHLIPRRAVEKTAGGAEIIPGNYVVDPVVTRVFLDVKGSSQIRNGDSGTLATITNETTGLVNPMAIHRSVYAGAFEFLPSARSYRMALTSVSTPPSWMRYSASKAGAGDWVSIGSPYVSSGSAWAYYGTRNNTHNDIKDLPDPWNPLSPAASLAAVNAGSGNLYYHDQPNNRVYVKVVQGQQPIYVTTQEHVGGSKLTGTLISNSQGVSSAPNAVDGSFSTYYNAGIYAGGWVGLDLGSPKVITRIRFCPRSGYPNSMNDGRFEVANNPDFSDAVLMLRLLSAVDENVWTDYTVNKTTTPYRYVRYRGPYNQFSNIAEMEWYGY